LKLKKTKKLLKINLFKFKWQTVRYIFSTN